MNDAGDFAAYLTKGFLGEVYGEAVFRAMADASSDADARYKWRVLETLERETKEYLGRALRERGCEVPEESAEGVAQGEKLGRTLAGVPRAVLMPGLRSEVEKFVAEYEAGEAAAPADGLTVARHFTTHERAILEFVNREIAGRSEDSLEPVLKLLAAPPAR